MVFFPLVALALLASSVSALPLEKRIAQVISDSTTLWEAACNKAGGGAQCNSIAVNSFTTLLAAAKACDQQDAADNMINLAKTLQNNADVIKFAQIFAQQPRNSPTSQSVQYCQQAPKNAELNGLFQCQFKGDNPTVFVGGVAVGQPGTIPFGQSAPLSPPGSCAANPSGPIADGTQLTDITQSPGVPSAGGGTPAAPPPSPPAASSSPAAVAPPAATSSAPAAIAPPPATTSSAAAPPPATTSSAAAPPPSPAPAPPASGFALANGQAAQKLNAQFATLTASSPCTAGDQACVNGGFAQCVGGKFAITGCSGGTTCAALPLVNKPGTSITCTTPADALARIAATGAPGGLTG